MPSSKDRIDSLHDHLPSVFNTRVNPTWSALIEAIGESDNESLQLIEAVREQFFIKTAKRPYLDRLGATNLVQRPRFIGMDDETFRRFIPVMAYNPKQVKLVLDDLLDLFFFKDATTSFAETTIFEPFSLKDGWELEYLVDSDVKERIIFKEEEFSNISSATALEIVSAINRQSTNSYAIAFENGITKEITIRLFTNTVGAKGYISITGGRASIGLQFDGYNKEAGQGVATEWQVEKIGDTVTMTFTGSGGSPKLETVSPGDVVIIDRIGNSGSFIIEAVDIVNNSITFKNLFATPETFTVSSVNDVKFISLVKNSVYLKDRRAIVWQVSPGEIVVELPPSPPVVRRNRKGASHINGATSDVISFNRSLSNMTIKTTKDFPTTGAQFYFIPDNEIQTFFPVEGDTTIFNYKSRLVSDMPIYSYSSRVGNLLQGITPSLPTEASLNQFSIGSANRDSNNTITVTTTLPHNYKVDNYVIIDGVTLGSGIGPTVNGTWKITEVVSSTQFKVYSFAGPAGARSSTGGTVRMEKAASSTIGGLVILRSAQSDPRRNGPYLWSDTSDFVLSSLTTNLTAPIKAGLTKKNIQVTPNDIPSAEGQLIFDFGTERQEGPVRYFQKPNDLLISIDPSYVFKKDHDFGSAVTMIRRRGAIRFQGFGAELAPYITDPAAAREVLKELMEQVKSVGIFLNFLVRYPVQYYSTVDVYSSGIDPG
jgi:hypothetical protein